MKACLAVLFLVYVIEGAIAGDVKIGLYYGNKIESIVFSAVDGDYMLYGNNKQVAVIKKGAICHIELSGAILNIHTPDNTLGSYTAVSLIAVSASGIFQVRPVFPSLPSKESDDRLDISIDNGFLKLINSLDLEEYIPGTVEAEGGSAALPEYYKAQAVITRTFAVRSYYRHAHEGFNLCDGVHCQAFNGKSRMNKEIYNAAKATAGEILADKHGEPVITAYHASCGGMTGSASVVWNRDLSYLAPVSDPFCNKSSNRNWSKTLPLADWESFLKRLGFTGNIGTLYSGESGRRKYLDHDGRQLLLTDIREELRLRSSWFHVEDSGNSIIISGHGYGHGLGLCQEGAMEMAKAGYTYVDILMFYFTGLELK